MYLICKYYKKCRYKQCYRKYPMKIEHTWVRKWKWDFVGNNWVMCKYERGTFMKLEVYEGGD